MSPVIEIDWSPVLVPLNVPLIVEFSRIVKVFESVPPAIVNPFSKLVGLIPLIVLFINASVPLIVASVPLVGSVTSELLVVLMVVEPVPANVKSLEVSILPPNLIIFVPLSLPVPPKFGAITWARSCVPLKSLPYIFLSANNLVAVLALPVNSPIKLVEVTDAKPAIVFVVAPKGILVEPSCTALFANWSFVIPASAAKLLDFNPFAEILSPVMSIPDPAVNLFCFALNVVQSAEVIKPLLLDDAEGIFNVIWGVVLL